MADHRAIAAVGEAIIHLLRASYDPAVLQNELEFKLFTSRDFANPLESGASVFLYRVFPHGTMRTPAGRIGVNGERQRSRLPVELHFLVTVWGKTASLQHTLAGWVMRTIEDTPLLPAGVLNAVSGDVFHADETVELTLGELRTEDLLRIWEVLGLGVYQLCIPYQARIVHIDSIHSHEGGAAPVQTRRFEWSRSEEVAR